MFTIVLENNATCYLRCSLQVGLLSKGQWSGLTWLWKEGGTFLHGPVDYFGQWSGNQIAYIYPDLKHCLLGSYTKGKLEVAQFCYVASIRFIKGYIPYLTYSECQGEVYISNVTTVLK